MWEFQLHIYTPIVDSGFAFLCRPASISQLAVFLFSLSASAYLGNMRDKMKSIHIDNTL